MATPRPLYPPLKPRLERNLKEDSPLCLHYCDFGFCPPAGDRAVGSRTHHISMLTWLSSYCQNLSDVVLHLGIRGINAKGGGEPLAV